jgi:hypothetical protein
MGAREELRRKVGGLDVELLGDFFMDVKGKVGQVLSVDTLYQDYICFCQARAAEPGSQEAFTEIFNRLMTKIRKEMLQ